MSADTWLGYAKQDFAAAKTLWPEHFAAACFHLQQTWEKCLKAVLVHERKGLQKTHDIRHLAKKAGADEKWDGELRHALTLLHPFTIPNNERRAGRRVRFRTHRTAPADN